MKPTLLCLHGWGGSSESFTELRAALKGANIEILTPDLPGFGSAKDPPEAWSTEDYADWVEKFLQKHPHNGPLFLLGHSHGGRIAILLASRRTLQIAHLYLCAAAGIRHPRHFKRIVGLTLAKTGKTLLKIPGLKTLEPLGKKLLYRLVRVHDYEQANAVMRGTLIKVSAEDLRPLLSHISVSTDLFWGEQDSMTPLKDAFIMHRAIAGSSLHTYPGIRHRVHRDRSAEIAAIIKGHMQENTTKTRKAK